mmetsp:Transcript_8250/g.25532  ORF Transcript_8250/g.25532 Transcript_8250/m.25532 type:complete len:528 (-) Transcript_8250:183-1766(-)
MSVGELESGDAAIRVGLLPGHPSVVDQDDARRDGEDEREVHDDTERGEEAEGSDGNELSDGRREEGNSSGEGCVEDGLEGARVGVLDSAPEVLVVRLVVALGFDEVLGLLPSIDVDEDVVGADPEDDKYGELDHDGDVPPPEDDAVPEERDGEGEEDLEHAARTDEERGGVDAQPDPDEDNRGDGEGEVRVDGLDELLVLEEGVPPEHFEFLTRFAGPGLVEVDRARGLALHVVLVDEVILYPVDELLLDFAVLLVVPLGDLLLAFEWRPDVHEAARAARPSATVGLVVEEELVVLLVGAPVDVDLGLPNRRDRGLVRELTIEKVGRGVGESGVVGDAVQDARDGIHGDHALAGDGVDRAELGGVLGLSPELALGLAHRLDVPRREQPVRAFTDIPAQPGLGVEEEVPVVGLVRARRQQSGVDVVLRRLDHVPPLAELVEGQLPLVLTRRRLLRPDQREDDHGDDEERECPAQDAARPLRHHPRDVVDPPLAHPAHIFPQRESYRLLLRRSRHPRAPREQVHPPRIG